MNSDVFLKRMIQKTYDHLQAAFKRKLEFTLYLTAQLTACVSSLEIKFSFWNMRKLALPFAKNLEMKW